MYIYKPSNKPYPKLTLYDRHTNNICLILIIVMINININLDLYNKSNLYCVSNGLRSTLSIWRCFEKYTKRYMNVIPSSFPKRVI